MTRTASYMTAMALALAARSGVAMPLQEAVRLAALRDPVVGALRQDVAQQDTNIEILKDGERPKLSVNVGRASSVGTNQMLAEQQNIGSEIMATQTLFDWGKVSAQIEGANYDRVQIVSDLKKQLETVIFNIAGLYLDADMASAKLAATVEYRKNAQKLADMTRDRVVGGLGDVSETARARLEISRADERLQSIQSDRDVALDQLKLLVGVPAIEPEDVPELAYVQRVDTPDVLLASVKTAPDYLKSNAAMNSARAGIDVAKAVVKPALQLQASVHPGFSGAGPNSAAVGLMVGVNLGMSDLFGRQARAAQEKFAGTEKRLEGVQRDLINQSQGYARQIKALTTSEASLKLQVDEARHVVAVYEDQWTAGLRNMTDIFGAVQELYSTEINWIEAGDQLRRTEYKAANALGLQGTLLREKTGDPAVPDLRVFLNADELKQPQPSQKVPQPTAPFDDPGHYSMLPVGGRREAMQ